MLKYIIFLIWFLIFSKILKESTNPESFPELIEYYNYQSTNVNYQPKAFSGNILKIIFIAEWKEECKIYN